MKTNNHLSWISIGVFALFLTGCASEVLVDNQVSNNEPLQSQHKGQNKVVVVDVVSNRKSEDVVDQLSAAIVSKLRSKGAFRRVLSRSVTLENQFDLVVSVTPKRHQNQDIAQGWLGIFGGQSAIEVEVSLLDGNNGHLLAKGTIEARAPPRITIFTSTSMALAIDLVGDEVAKFVLNHI
jgi:hypothetical protein